MRRDKQATRVACFSQAKGEITNMISQELRQELLVKINKIENQKRRALSARFPLLKNPIIKTKRLLKTGKNISDHQLKVRRGKDYYPHVIARHQSILRRKLGDSDNNLQEAKIINLQQAIKKIDKIIIPSGQTFSYWQTIGKPTARRGYVDGMLLANGRVSSGMGGGLCQLSNFLFWILMHCDTTITERYHHSFDVFPDSGRTLPFGSGATVLYNFIDLQIKNEGSDDLQIKIYLNNKHLKGQILSNNKPKYHFHLFEKNHYFIKSKQKYHRYNEIWRQKKSNGIIQKEEILVKNLAPVLYKINEKQIRQQGQKIIKL